MSSHNPNDSKVDSNISHTKPQDKTQPKLEAKLEDLVRDWKRALPNLDDNVISNILKHMPVKGSDGHLYASTRDQIRHLLPLVRDYRILSEQIIRKSKHQEAVLSEQIKAQQRLIDSQGEELKKLKLDKSTTNELEPQSPSFKQVLSQIDAQNMVINNLQQQIGEFEANNLSLYKLIATQMERSHTDHAQIRQLTSALGAVSSITRSLGFQPLQVTGSSPSAFLDSADSWEGKPDPPNYINSAEPIIPSK